MNGRLNLAPGPKAAAADGEMLPMLLEVNGEPSGRCMEERRAAELSAEPNGDELAANWLRARFVPRLPGLPWLEDVLKLPVNGFVVPAMDEAPVRAAAVSELLPIPAKTKRQSAISNLIL